LWLEGSRSRQFKPCYQRSNAPCTPLTDDASPGGVFRSSPRSKRARKRSKTTSTSSIRQFLRNCGRMRRAKTHRRIEELVIPLCCSWYLFVYRAGPCCLTGGCDNLLTHGSAPEYPKALLFQEKLAACWLCAAF